MAAQPRGHAEYTEYGPGPPLLVLATGPSCITALLLSSLK